MLFLFAYAKNRIRTYPSKNRIRTLHILEACWSPWRTSLPFSVGVISGGSRGLIPPATTSPTSHHPRRDHITPILRQLHWLPVRRRVDFKIAVLVFQSDGGLSACRRRQRSATSISRHSDDLCHAPHVHLRRPMLCSCRFTAMELAANRS